MMAHWQWGTASAAVVEALLILMLAGLSIAANNRAVAWCTSTSPRRFEPPQKAYCPGCGPMCG